MARPISWFCLSLTLWCCAGSGLTAVEHERAAAAARTAHEAERHRERARELRAHELQVCGGVPDEERDLGPFAHADRIERVEPLLERAIAKGPPTVPVGAIVYLRAAPGLTVEWLERIIDCHLAHHAVVGTTPVVHGACPLLADESPDISVRGTAGGFAVMVKSSALHGDEVLRCARALQPASAK
jgi:hypothetical protein